MRIDCSFEFDDNHSSNTGSRLRLPALFDLGNQNTNCTVFQGRFYFFRNIFPPNLVQATIQQSQTVLTPPTGDGSTPDNSTIEEILKWNISEKYIDGE